MNEYKALLDEGVVIFRFLTNTLLMKVLNRCCG